MRETTTTVCCHNCGVRIDVIRRPGRKRNYCNARCRVEASRQRIVGQPLDLGQRPSRCHHVDLHRLPIVSPVARRYRPPMCHPDVPDGRDTPQVQQAEVSIELPSGERMTALMARAGSEAAPAVLVVSDIFGRSPFYEDLAARLAATGYHALLPDYFFRQGPLAEHTREAAFARRNPQLRRQLHHELPGDAG